MTWLWYGLAGVLCVILALMAIATLLACWVGSDLDNRW